MTQALSLKEIVKFLVLSGLAGILTFTVFDHYYEPGIDGPLPWVFNYLIGGHMALGKDIIFPHGPLAFLTYPLCMGNNWLVAVLFFCMIKLFLSFTIFYLNGLNNSSNLAMPFLIVLILCELFTIQYILFAAVASCYLIYLKTNAKGWILPALLLCSLAIYMKSFAGAVTSVLTLSFILIQFSADRKISQALGILSTWIFLLLSIWLLLYKTFQGFPRFVFGQFQLMQDNSSAVSFYPDNNWWLLVCCLLLFLLPLFIHRDRQLNRYYLLFIGSLFAAWKYGMAREDVGHVKGFWNFMLLFFSFLFVFFEKRKFLTLISGTLLLCLLYVNMTSSVGYKEMELNGIAINVFRDFVFHTKKLQEEGSTLSEKSIKINKLDENSMRTIGLKTIDIYPWDYSYIPANNLNWQPRPVLQSYASYTSWLDRQNAEHFKSDRAPDFLIWGLSKLSTVTDKGNIESIDDRYLLNDEPNTIISLLNRYQLKEKHLNFLLFEKSKDGLLQDEKKIGAVNAKWDEWINVPEEQDGVLRAKVSFSENSLGKIKSFLYKDEEFSVSYQLADQEVFTFRIVPKNAKDGIWVNPLILHPESKFTEPLVKRILFQCSNPKVVNEQFEISWALTGVNSTNHSVRADSSDYPYRNAFSLFGKKKALPSQLTTLFSATNKLDKNSPHWSFPYSHIISPGAFSSTLVLDLDTLLNSSKFDFFSVFSSVQIKASKNAKATCVISIEKGDVKLAYLSVNVHEFIKEADTWNPVALHQTIYEKIPRNENVKLKVYIWNSGNEPITIDNFKVDVTGSNSN